MTGNSRGAYFYGGLLVNVSALSGFGVGGLGTYPLIKGASALVMPNNVAFTGPSGYYYSLAANGTSELDVLVSPLYSWTAASGNWSFGANWGQVTAPGSWQAANFTAAGSYAVTVDAGQTLDTVNFLGSGNWTVSGGNTLTVATAVNFGSAGVSPSWWCLGTSPAFSTTSALTTNTGSVTGVFGTYGNGPTVNLSASLAGTANLNMYGGNVTIGGADSRSGSLSVYGGTLTLSGSSIGYSGATAVYAGTLNVTGTMASSSSGITVGSSNTGSYGLDIGNATLGGTGTINRNVTLYPNGTLTGLLTINGTVYLNCNTIIVGGTGTLGTLTMTTLDQQTGGINSMVAHAQLWYELGQSATPTGDLINVTGSISTALARTSLRASLRHFDDCRERSANFYLAAGGSATYNLLPTPGRG